MHSQPSNQTSPPPVDQPNHGDRFSNWFEFLHFLITDRQGIRILRVLLIFFAVFTLASAITIQQIIKFMSPQEIEITSQLGTVRIKNGDTQNAVFLLSPSGEDEETYWVKTGIIIKKGDHIKITASGRVNTAVKRMVAQTIRPESDELTWASPSGLPLSTPNIYYVERLNEAKVYPDKKGVHYGFGMLIAAVKDSTDQKVNITPYTKDNEFIQFTAERDGELVLTVNDIWLNRDSKNIYAPPFKDNFEYYLQIAKLNAAFKDEDFDSWSDEKKIQEAEKQYEKRNISWNTIISNSNWNIWYEDNIGSFSVSITVEPSAS